MLNWPDSGGHLTLVDCISALDPILHICCWVGEFSPTSSQHYRLYMIAILLQSITLSSHWGQRWGMPAVPALEKHMVLHIENLCQKTKPKSMPINNQSIRENTSTQTPCLVDWLMWVNFVGRECVKRTGKERKAVVCMSAQRFRFSPPCLI